MKQNKPYSQLLDFFHGFVTLMNCREFDETYARQLAAMLEKHDIVDDILENPLQELRLAHFTKHCNGNASSLVMFVEAGFRALAAHMRDPQTRELVAALVEMVDQHTNTEMFARVSNIRLLDPKDDDGPAVITMVVHSKAVFRKWFRDPDICEIQTVHGSFALEDETPKDDGK